MQQENVDILRELLDPKRIEIEEGEKLIKKTIREGAEKTLETRGIEAMVQMVNQGKQNIDKPKKEKVTATGVSVPASTPFTLGGINAQGDTEAPGMFWKGLSALRTGSLAFGGGAGGNDDEWRRLREERLQKQLDLMYGKENRLSNQNAVNNMKYFGASITPEMLANNPTLNSVVTPLVKNFGITPEVNQNNEITFEIPMQSALEQKALLGGKLKEKELSSIVEKLPNLDRAMAALDSLKETFDSAWQPKSIEEGQSIEGLMERIRGTGSIPLESWTQTNPELHTYLSNVGAFSSLLSKGGFMEAGVLTNQDIQRVLQALPKPGYSKERVELGWETITDVFTNSRKNYEQKLKEYSVNGKTEKSTGGNEKSKTIGRFKVEVQ